MSTFVDFAKSVLNDQRFKNGCHEVINCVLLMCITKMQCVLIITTFLK